MVWFIGPPFFKCQKYCLIALLFLRGNSEVNSSKKVGFSFALKITELLVLWLRAEETVVEGQVAEHVLAGRTEVMVLCLC
jgi:hypothetical protein